jgi:hypothetical protein
MSNIAALSLLSYFPEATQGTPPADAAAWIASGVRLRHIGDSLDISGVERSLLEDMRNQSRVFGTEARVQGIDNPEFPFAVYAHGLGEATAAGAQVATDAPGYQLAALLGHALGGISRGYSNAIDGATSTTTVIAVTDASSHAVGDFVAVGFATPPTGYPSGTAWPRRITEIDTVSTPNTLTLDQALPQAPASGDPVHACVVVYPDQDVLADSAGAAGRTRSWLVQKGLPGAGASLRESWVFPGCVAQLQQFSFDRNAPAQYAFQVMAGSHVDPSAGPWPTAWAANAEIGLAPLAITPITEVWLEDQATTTNTRVHVSSFQVEPGAPRVRNEVLTSHGVNMQGTYNYVTQPAETTISMTIVPFGTDQWTDQVAETARKLRWSRLGPAGSGMAVHFEYVTHIKTPSRQPNGAATGAGVQFKAHESTTLGTSELQRAKLCIVMW